MDLQEELKVAGQESLVQDEKNPISSQVYVGKHTQNIFVVSVIKFVKSH